MSRNPTEEWREPSDGGDPNGGLRPFASDLVDRVRASGYVWRLPGGQLELPRVFGFCRGVKRALAVLGLAVDDRGAAGRRLVLLGEIIHNPWVNEYFKARGITILSDSQRGRLGDVIGARDCAVIPAFGVPLELERQLAALGSRIVDTTCGDVRRLWRWAEQAARRGYAVLIYGRSRHDETVVTKSRLAAAGGQYVVVGDLEQARVLCGIIAGEVAPGRFGEVFDREATNASGVQPLLRLAQVSQTTMLYDETMQLRELLRSAFVERFGPQELEARLLFHPTVCRATQERQTAAVQLCKTRPDLAIVVGGFGSSNTRHLHELAGDYCPAYFIEDAGAISSRRRLMSFDPAADEMRSVGRWLPVRRPLRIAVLAGASCPEIVVGQVLRRLASFLS